MVVDKRSRAQEMDQAIKFELEFKAEARRNKLLGLWAAENLGLSGDAAEAYAMDVVASDMDEPGPEDVVRKVMKDFTDNGIAIDEKQLCGKMDELIKIARTEVLAENT
ncbi:MAG TPA: DUF1476 domain-containing protein [Rhodospirillales bacterium]|jgi:hypothetical protein|nr:DUF1476 domain-containing protein [Rhodospirillales bacterium]|tara:strand:+ start:217 stop:540 length:324 start_codon:yes stop_codon:yes gene_type:complete